MRVLNSRFAIHESNVVRTFIDPVALIAAHFFFFNCVNDDDDDDDAAVALNVIQSLTPIKSDRYVCLIY